MTDLNEGKNLFIDKIRSEDMPSSDAAPNVSRTRNINTKLSLPENSASTSNAQLLDTSYEEDDDEEQQPVQSPMAVVKEEGQPQEEEDDDESSDSEMDDASHSNDATSEQNEDE